jgi:hypothetical protein
VRHISHVDSRLRCKLRASILAKSKNASKKIVLGDRAQAIYNRLP